MWFVLGGVMAVSLLWLLAIWLLSNPRTETDPLDALDAIAPLDFSGWPVAVPPPPGALAGRLSVAPQNTVVEARTDLSTGKTWAYAFHHRFWFANHHFHYMSLMRDSGFRVLDGRDQLEIEALEVIDVRWAEQYVNESEDILVTFCRIHDPEFDGINYEVYVELRPDIPVDHYDQAGIIAEDSLLREQFNEIVRREYF